VSVFFEKNQDYLKDKLLHYQNLINEKLDVMQFKLSFHRLCLAPKFIWGSIKKQTLASPGFSVPVSPRHCRGFSCLQKIVIPAKAGIQTP